MLGGFLVGISALAEIVGLRREDGLGTAALIGRVSDLTLFKALTGCGSINITHKCGRAEHDWMRKNAIDDSGLYCVFLSSVPLAKSRADSIWPSASVYVAGRASTAEKPR